MELEKEQYMDIQIKQEFLMKVSRFLAEERLVIVK